MKPLVKISSYVQLLPLEWEDGQAGLPYRWVLLPFPYYIKYLVCNSGFAE